MGEGRRMSGVSVALCGSAPTRAATFPCEREAMTGNAKAGSGDPSDPKVGSWGLLANNAIA